MNCKTIIKCYSLIYYEKGLPGCHIFSIVCKDGSLPEVTWSNGGLWTNDGLCTNNVWHISWEA